MIGLKEENKGKGKGEVPTRFSRSHLTALGSWRGTVYPGEPVLMLLVLNTLYALCGAAGSSR